MRLAIGASAVLALLVLSAPHAPAQAQTTAPGPYYAVPSWDQTLPSATRFVVLSNFGGQAVLDRDTGLVWDRAPDTTTQRTWSQAVQHCLIRDVGSRSGWRLPAIHELRSLLDTSRTTPPLPVGHPFGDLFGEFRSYWSATPGPDLGAFIQSFGISFSLGQTIKTEKNLAWCVRGGAGTAQ